MKYAVRLRIGSRLALSFAAVVTLIALLAVVAYADLADARARTTELTHAQAERLQLAAEWRENILVNSQRALAIAYSADKTLAGRFEKDMKRVTARTSEIQKRFAEVETTPAGVAAQAKLAEGRKAYLGTREAIMALPAEADPAQAAQLGDTFKAATLHYIEVAGEMVKLERDRSDVLAEEVHATLERTQLRLVLAATVCAALAALLGWLIARSIVRPLRVAQATALRIADGDLGAPVPAAGADETGELLHALGRMQDALRRLVGEIRSSADSINVASAEVAAGNQDLSVRTEQASANLQQTASSVEQISSTMRHSADAALQADALARGAADVAGQGGEVVGRVVGTMQSISESSRRIGDIVGVIDGIAFQTNILALNAAVEAARAGEQGKGFAVVASEVRALAHRSAGAAKEIKGLITQSVERVEQGASQVEEAGRTIEGVIANVRRVSDIVGEISSASVEQSKGIGEVNTAVSQLDQATQQNAALVEESAAAAASLKEQVVLLAASVQRFKLPSHHE
jgi:methyl-accepting chemotaxis protein